MTKGGSVNNNLIIWKLEDFESILVGCVCGISLGVKVDDNTRDESSLNIAYNRVTRIGEWKNRG